MVSKGKRKLSSRAESLRKDRTGSGVVTGFIVSLFAISFAMRLSAGIETEKMESMASDLFRGEVEFENQSSDIGSLLSMIEKKGQELEKREEQVREQEVQMEKSQDLLARQILDLEQAELRLKEILGLAQEAAGEDVRKLVDLYQKMKPKEAAAVFSMMEPVLAAGFLSEMNSGSASQIMAKLSPEKSYAISVVLAGRNVR